MNRNFKPLLHGALSCLLICLALIALDLGCVKTYSTAPLSAALVPTATLTPCGYPGNTCTFTPSPSPSNTPTSTCTETITNTPTVTSTYTVTNTPTPLPTIQGLFGLQDTSNYPTLIWVKDSNPNITSYKIYVSTDDATWTLLGNPAKTAFTTPFCQVNDTSQAAPFTRYYYVVASNGGTPPDSPPSPQVWAISGTSTTNDLAFNVTGPPLTCTISSGSVPGAVNRVWVVEDASLNTYWGWEEGGVGATAETYGYNATGITYAPAQTLSAGSTYVFGTFSLNSNNWTIDLSSQDFINP